MYNPNEYPDTQMTLKVLNGSQFPIFDVAVVEVVDVERPDLRWRIDARNEPILNDARVLAGEMTFELLVHL